jgi:NTE family protein
MTTISVPTALRILIGLLLLLALPSVTVAQQPYKPRRALVVSGGGAKGAYAAGVLSVLMRDTAVTATAFVRPDAALCVVPPKGSLTFDVLVGTSTGALITPLAHQRRIREMTRFYTTFGTADVLTQRPIFEALTKAPSFYTVGPLRRLLLEEYSATGLWEGIKNDPNKTLVVTGVDLQRGHLVLFYAGRPPSNWDVAEVGVRWQPIGDEQEFVQAILASSSEPVGMPPVAWRNSLIWDGGVRSAIPLSIALAQKGVEEVWVIGLNPSPDSPMRSEASQPATGLQVLSRTIDVFSSNVAANDIAKMRLLVGAWGERAHTTDLQHLGRRVLDSAPGLPESLRKEAAAEVEQLKDESRARDTVLGASQDDFRRRVQVFVIQPAEKLPGSSLLNTLQDQRRMYLLGQKDADGFLDWLKDECKQVGAVADSTGKAGQRAALFHVFTQRPR